MTKNFFKIALLAICALTLLAGSALATGIEGRMTFSGNRAKFTDNNGAVVSFSNATNISLYATINYAPGNFNDDFGYITDGSWGTPPSSTNPPSLLLNFQFRDDFLGTDFSCGSVPCISEFITLKDSQGHEFKFSVDTFGTYSYSTDNLSITAYGTVKKSIDGNLIDSALGEWKFNINSMGDNTDDFYPWFAVYKTTPEPPSAIPEPASLVLLGTGLLSAALVARRKMK